MPTDRPVPSRTRLRRIARTSAVLASVAVLTVTGYAWNRYQDLATGLRRSGTLSGLTTPAAGATQNILVMGLDSRLDENGDPLPPALYEALDTGGADVGGYNANVLMLLHIPGDGSRATAISIPRDDYVDLAGSPDGTARGKIKQAYGLAFDQRHKELVADGTTDPVQLEQASRDAGRNAEIATVSQFLGDVSIDHFVEVTMVAFYQIAQVVAPITVCVNEDTRDSYSGANFHQGYQQIDAAQAVAFVRQRRDNTHPQLNFTDLDRERRQQAFIASLAYQLKQAGTLTDPSKLEGLIGVAKQNTAIDPGLDLLALADQAASLTSGNITFTTLPIDHFGTDARGEDVNVVDLATVRSTVQRLLAPPAAQDGAPTGSPPPSATVDVVNAGGHIGLAAAVSRMLVADGYIAVADGNATRRTASSVEYAPQDSGIAAALASSAGIAATAPDTTLEPGHLRVVLGSGYRPGAAHPTATASPIPESAAGSATTGAAISGGAIPCVK